GDLSVRLRAGGVHGEHESVASIRERVEDQLEAVLLACDEVFADVVDDDAGLLRGVMTEDADVKRVTIEDETHLGGLCCELTLVRLRLHEIDRRLRLAPHFFLERAVEHDRDGGSDGDNRSAAVGRGERLTGSVRRRVGDISGRERGGQKGETEDHWGRAIVPKNARQNSVEL